MKKYVQRIHNAGGLIYQNLDGTCEIMVLTGEKPVKSRFHDDPVFYLNLNTEVTHTSISYSGGLTRLCATLVAKLWNTHRAFLIFNSPEKMLARAG